MEENYITVFFDDGEYIVIDIRTYVKHHYLRLDEPVDWTYFLETEHDLDLNEITGYLISKEKDFIITF